MPRQHALDTGGTVFEYVESMEVQICPGVGSRSSGLRDAFTPIWFTVRGAVGGCTPQVESLMGEEMALVARTTVDCGARVWKQGIL